MISRAFHKVVSGCQVKESVCKRMPGDITYCNRDGLLSPWNQCFLGATGRNCLIHWATLPNIDSINGEIPRTPHLYLLCENLPDNPLISQWLQ